MYGQSGIKISALGIIIAMIGGILFAIEEMAKLNGSLDTLALIVLIAGCIIFVIGLVVMLFASVIPPEGTHEDDIYAPKIALIRCMVAMSISDNDLDDKEIQKIEQVFASLTDERIDSGMVREIAISMLEEETNTRNSMLKILILGNLCQRKKCKSVRESFRPIPT